MEALTTLQDEIKYSTGVKSRAAGLANGLKYVELSPITGNEAKVAGGNFLWNIVDTTSFLDTSRSEILFDISATWTAAGASTAIYPEGSSAFFRNAIVRSLGSGAELCRVSAYNKLSAVFRRAKMPAGGSLTKEGAAMASGPTFGATVAVGSEVSSLKIADGEFAAKTNTHRAFANGSRYNMSLPLRGLGILSLTSGEHGKYVPLCLSNGLQLELQLEASPFECIYGITIPTDLSITISNIRLKLALIEYDPTFIAQMKASMAQAGGLLLSVPRWKVDQFSSNQTSLNFQVGLVAQSLRMVAVINDRTAEVNTASYAHLSLSPAFNCKNFFLQLNGSQYPNRALNNQVQQMTYAEEALGGFSNNIDFNKYAYASKTLVTDLIAGDATYSNAVIGGCNILAIDCDAAPNAKTLNGKPTGVSLNVNIERDNSENGESRNFYVCSYYDTILRLDPNDGSITEVQ